MSVQNKSDSRARPRDPAGPVTGVLFAVFLVVSLAYGQSPYTLSECIAIALENNHDMRAARLSTQSALSDRRGSLSTILPTVTYSAAFANQGTYFNPQFGFPIPESQYYSAGLFLSQNIFDGGKWWNQISEARNRYGVALESQRQTEVAVVLSVKRAFYQYLKDRQLVEVARQSVRLAQQQLALVKQQYEVEAVARSDLLKQQVRVGEMRVDFMNQQTALMNSLNELTRVMGLPLDSTFTVVDSPDDESPPFSLSFDAAMEEVKNRNPSLVAKRGELVGAQLRVRVARADYLPTLSASVSYDGFADVFDELYSDLERNWRRQVRFSVSFPLFRGLSRPTQVSRARIEHEILQEQYQNLLKDLEVQVDATLRQLKNLDETIPVFEQTKQAAEEDLRLAQERYHLGAATILDVLDAQLSVLRANSSLVTAIYDRKILHAQLQALMGKS